MQPAHFLLLVATCAVWGLNFVASKLGVNHFPPLFFVGLRFGIVLLCLLPFLRWAPGRMRDVILIALFNGAFHFGLLFLGIAMTEASIVAVVVQLNAPFATMLSIVWLGEVIRWRRWTGIALTFLGVAIISVEPHIIDAPAGVLFSVAAAFSGAVAAILMRRLTNVGVFQLQSWTAAVTAPALLLASLVFETGQMEAVASADAMAWASLLYTTIGASLIGHNVYYWLLQRYEVSLLAPLTLLSPILGVFFGITLLDEPFTTRIAMGALVAFAGVAILALRNRIPVEPES